MLTFLVSGTLTKVFDNPIKSESVDTPFGEPSSPIEYHDLEGTTCLVLFRHGRDGGIPAHRVNYRSNIWALKESGATHVLAYATTGSVDPDLPIGSFVVPDQIVDYTHDRVGSFETSGIKEHFDFTYPFSSDLRERVIEAAFVAGLSLRDGGTYACSQGPRYETAAEIAKFGRDGCSIVGMTLMPEASLARQIELTYAALALVMNPGAGIDQRAVDIPGSIRYTDDAVQPLQRFNSELVKRIP
ncbi:MAG: S-methyl-5'-thioinosine phosphorylase [Gammaproteobacteria bacterium]|nr:S-methyl-5'-thioinosine phosphorylase [Gammaproteobacteria bacterium]